MPHSAETFKNARLLLVDDDPDTCDLVAHYLEEHDITIKSASNGQEALDLIAEFDPDLVVSDLKMPVMSGDKMLMTLHQSGFIKPVLFLTGFEDLSTVLKSYEYDLYGFLQKPIDPDVLVAVVRRFLRMEYQRALRQETIRQLALIAHSCLPDETADGLVNKARLIAHNALNSGRE